ncbi:MAG TPA: hypothetical protein PLH98_11535 [Ruminococcus flavefaciens]|nr:hypothetical protein [Ruminococcus flavefaciens]
MGTTITENEQIDTTSRMTTEDKMELYYSRREQLQLLDLQEQSEIDTVLTPEILARVDEIRAKYKDTKEAVGFELSVLEKEIKESVLTMKETIKSKNVMAVWNKGRVSWDSKLLEGMAKLEPKLLAARKEGEPTVSIRFNK